MGPTWPFLLMYGSHDMRHTGFRRLTAINGTTLGLGRHTQYIVGVCLLLYIGGLSTK